MKTSFVAATLVGVIVACGAPAKAAPKPVVQEQVLLWPDGAPGAKGNEVIDRPALTIHRPQASGSNGAAVVVNPGGGYRVLASDHEGLQVAHWLNSVGITAFVLRYRLTPKYEPSEALLDAQRAIRYVRSHARQLGVSPKRIGMLGFSAGGHLTAAAGTSFDAGNSKADDPIDRVSSRPDFIVPVYPVVSGALLDRNAENYANTATQVTAATPATFLVHTHRDDAVSPNNSILFYQALLEKGVPAEMHIFGQGPHGTGLAPGDPDINQWPALLHRWLRRQGVLTDLERVGVSGSVSIDGQPLFWGWVTLLPEDDNLPMASAYLLWRDKGEFSIDPERGPCPGRYRVEVHRVAADFSEPATGAYSLEDAERFTTALPGGENLTVDIVAGANDLKIEITTGSSSGD